jgi:hypothetical protein
MVILIVCSTNEGAKVDIDSVKNEHEVLFLTNDTVIYSPTLMHNNSVMVD